MAVGRDDDFVQIGDGRLILDLDHDVRLALQAGEQPPQDIDVRGLADKGQRVKIDALLHPDSDIGAVLVREGRQAHLDSGQVDMPAAGQLARHRRSAVDPSSATSPARGQPDQAAVHQDDGARSHVPAHQGIVDPDPEDTLFRPLAARQQVDHLIGGQFNRSGQIARADFRTLDVHEQRDVPLGPVARPPAPGGSSSGSNPRPHGPC